MLGNHASKRIAPVLVALLLLEAAGLVPVTVTFPSECVESVKAPDCTGPQVTVELVDVTQSIDFTLDAYSYKIVQFSYSAPRVGQSVTYQLSFSVSGGTVEFFICTPGDASLWAAGSTIIVSTSDYWGGTSGLSIIRGFYSGYPPAFVFNHDGSGSRTVTGSVVVDTTPPSIVTSLVDGQTYSGDVVITASATDALAGVYRITLFIDGEEEFWAHDDIDYLWRTDSYSNGQHIIHVVAQDEDENFADLSFTVQVDNHLDLTLFLALGSVGLVAVVAGFAYWLRVKSRTKTGPTPRITSETYRASPVRTARRDVEGRSSPLNQIVKEPHDETHDD